MKLTHLSELCSHAHCYSKSWCMKMLKKSVRNNGQCMLNLLWNNAATKNPIILREVSHLCWHQVFVLFVLRHDVKACRNAFKLVVELFLYCAHRNELCLQSLYHECLNLAMIAHSAFTNCHGCAAGHGVRQAPHALKVLNASHVEEISLSGLTTRHFAVMLTKVKAAGDKFDVHGSTAWNAWSRMLFVNAWMFQIYHSNIEMT